MSIAVTWDDEAQCELNCTALYYAKRAGSELAERFINAVESAIERAQIDPLAYRRFHGDARKVRVRRFPYHIVFWHWEDEDIIHILAVASDHRDPGYWRGRRTE